MPNIRKPDQTVDAFSAPKALLAKAKQRAAQRGMGKSGFYRYCLAKELGYSESEAVEIAKHGALRNQEESMGAVRSTRYPEHRPSPYLMNDKTNSGKADAGVKLLKKHKPSSGGGSSKP